MTSIELTWSTVARRINDRTRIAPSQLFQSVHCLWLVLLDDALLCPETGGRHLLASRATGLLGDELVDGLVEGARQLGHGLKRPIGLALPLSQFLYSRYSIQLGAEYLRDPDMVHSAVALQKDVLLPAFEQDFALSTAAGSSEGVALWFPERILSTVETRFGAAGLELAAILPRPLIVAPDGGLDEHYVVFDEDSSSCAVVEMKGRVATRVISAFRREFENEEIKNAWDEQTAEPAAAPHVCMSSAEDWLALEDAGQVGTDYLFFTREFLQSVGASNRRRRAWAGGALAASALLVVSLPFVYQWADALRLESARAEYQERARVAAGYESEILDLEYEWGVVYEYPEADVAAILLGLNSVIDNSLTSFSLNDSTIEIQGSTQDPEKLTRLLLELPLFDSIEQSRSISENNSGSGDRFGLRLSLAGYDYAEYSRKYDFQ